MGADFPDKGCAVCLAHRTSPWQDRLPVRGFACYATATLQR